MEKELQIFQRHVAEHGLKHSKKREHVVQSFLKTERHVSAEDLLNQVKHERADIGYTTVYRTLKLIVSSGLGEMVDFDDGVRRYERKVGREYHAHFICTKCGHNFEIFDEKIKELSFRLAESKSFIPTKHRFEIFGICEPCK